MDSFSAIEALKDYPVFTMADLSRLLGSSDDYTKTYANRLEQKGRIKRIKRGSYTLYDDPLLVASYLYPPSYISLWAALRFYDATEQLPNSIDVAIPYPARRPIRFQGSTINFFTTKHLFGYSKRSYHGFQIMVADMEKVLVDCLITASVPLDQALNLLGCQGFSYEKLLKYSLMTKNKSLIRRIGYITDHFSNGFDTVPLLKQANPDYNYIPIDYLSSRKGNKDKKWHIIVNSDLNDIIQ